MFSNTLTLCAYDLNFTHIFINEENIILFKFWVKTGEVFY